MKKIVNKVVGSIAQAMLAVILMVAMAIWMAPILVDVLDANLAGLKFVTGHVPGGFGPTVEVALRGGLGIDQVMLFLELRTLVGALFLAVGWLWRRGQKLFVSSRKMEVFG